MWIYLTIFFLALIITILLTPMVEKFALKIGAVDIPDKRKIHVRHIPCLGGISLFAGVFTALGLVLVFSDLALNLEALLGIFIGSILILGVGIYDDLRGLSPRVKFSWQVLAALIVYFFGVEIGFVSNPFNGIYPLGIWVSLPLTLLWIVGVTNAINLIDGLDGLAAGVTAISAGTMFFVALSSGQYGAALLILALAGAALGFLKYNFYPARMFLGDSGSLLLGFILATTAITGVFKTTLVVALIIPVLILGVPIFDTMFAIGRRLSSGKHPFEADDKHIHHMLLRAGFSQREAVLSIYVACFLLSISALIMVLQR